MRTDELIRALVSDKDKSARPPSQHLLIALIGGLSVAAAGFAVALGPRPDISAAAMTIRFDFKIAVMLLLFAAAVAVVLRMSRPGAAPGFATIALLVAPALLVVAVAVELFVLPADRWQLAAIGSNARICLTAIPLLAIPVLAAAIYALRAGAAIHPVRTGAVAGLLSAAAAASLYAMHCTDDSPLFVAVWYTLATMAVSLLGAAAGYLWLRW